MTLSDVTRIEGFQLFQPHNYVDYEHVKQIIMDEYGEQEIAYPTPDMFKRKLNHALALRENNYNKMLQAQLIEIDPFVTEYIMNEGKAISKSFEDEGVKHEERVDRGVKQYTAEKTTGSESTGEEHTLDHSKQNADTLNSGKLFSEAENTNSETTRKLTKDATGHEEWTENTEQNVDTNIDKTSNDQTTDNQTGRQWTEKGSNEGHNLDVHSDMPQAMLFNQPQRYYGTGREHTEGIVTQDAEGNPVVSDFPETDPKQIDSARLGSDPGDSPYYNYATTADNKTGHDSYAKEGTETYQKNGSSNKTETETQTEDTTKNVAGTKDTEENLKEDETTNDGTGRALNSNEHVKSDEYHDEAYKEAGTGNKQTDTLGTSKGQLDRDEGEDTIRKEDRFTKSGTDTEDTRVYKGRRMMSPSKLLEEYRETLNFNADMWLLGELESLFLTIF